MVIVGRPVVWQQAFQSLGIGEMKHARRPRSVNAVLWIKKAWSNVLSLLKNSSSSSKPR